jgi:putative SOS response-associated peptidase YedK
MADRPTDDRFNPSELAPFGRAWVVRDDERGRGVDVMQWDVLGGQAKRPRGGGPPRAIAMTNVRNLSWPQWRGLAEKPENRCIVPLTEFCEWSKETYPVGDGKAAKGEMWFAVKDQPVFGVAGLWQADGDTRGFTMIACDPNELVAPIHPKAMFTILAEQDWDRWLTGSYEDVIALQQPYPADLMTVRGPLFPPKKAT